MNKISFLKLYFIFVKIGAILLGGGYVILPIITSELCIKRDLLKEDEIVDYYALSQSLPGIVAANISMFAGYKLRGKFGAIVGMLGVITVPFLAISFLASLIELFVNNKFINGIFWGVGVAVMALIILTVREMWQKSDRNWFFYLIFSVALVLLLIFNFSPVCVIILCSFTGIILKAVEAKRRNI